MTRRQLLSSLLGVALAGLALTGCTTSSSSDDPTGGTGGEAGAFPVTVTHAYGETTIGSAPQRVVTIGWSDDDIVLALGVVPVGAEAITWGGTPEGSSPWFDTKLAELGGTAPVRMNNDDGVAIDEIAALTPDLILGTYSGITQEEYNKLSQIAPTIAFPHDPWESDWRASTTMVGAALGQPAAAAGLIAATDAVMAQAAADNPQLAGKTLIFASVTVSDMSNFWYYTKLDSRPRFLIDLGMVNAPIIDQIADPGSYYGTVSSERATELVSDVFITLATAASDHDVIAADPLMGQVPAIAAGHLVAYPDQTAVMAMSAPSPLAIPYAVETFLPEVVKGVAGA